MGFKVQICKKHPVRPRDTRHGGGTQMLCHGRQTRQEAATQRLRPKEKGPCVTT